ncbi:MAG TPA: hypothetical protein VFP52_17360, partial [Myxococcales bacterium]|nr:hypothetical protein [Myxococcales bacterium]
KADRGITFVTVLIVVGLAAAALWAVGFGPAYVENFEVKRVLAEAANLSYRDGNDEHVKDFVFERLHQLFDEEVEDHGRTVREMRIDVDRGDLRIERTEVPRIVHIWLTYSRDVAVPVVNMERRLTFEDYVEQDLSPVKW